MFTHVFLDTNALLESRPFDDWDLDFLAGAHLVIGWAVLEELDRLKGRPGPKGERCRDLLHRVLTAGDAQVVLSELKNVCAVVPPRKYTPADVARYGLNPDEPDDCLLAEAERFRQEDSNSRTVGVLTSDKLLLIKIARLGTLTNLKGIHVPAAMRAARTRILDSRTEEEAAFLQAGRDLVNSLRTLMNASGSNSL